MKIVNKTSVGQRRVYDIEVEDVHNFYANGINVHNCATDGGVSVIKDGGTVVDIVHSDSAVTTDIWLRDNLVIYNASQFIHARPIPSADVSAGNRYGANPSDTWFAPRNKFISYTGGSFQLNDQVQVPTEVLQWGSSVAIANADRLNRAIVSDVYGENNALANFTTSTYNTGWMVGDIKGAFLSDTDDTDLVGSGEIWSGTPDRIDANWTDNLDGTYTSNGSAGFIGFANPAPLVNGKTYVVEITVDSLTSGSVSLPYDGTGVVAKTSVGTYVDTFIADAGGAYNGVYVYSNNFSGTVSNISVKLADPSRSV